MEDDQDPHVRVAQWSARGHPWYVRIMPRTLRTMFTACLLTLSCAEDPSDSTIDQRVAVPEAPAANEGMQFVMPEMTIPAGEEKMVCWVPDWKPDQDYLVARFVGFQGSMGHHVVALSSRVPRKAGDVFDCTSLEQMTTVEPLILADLPDGQQLLPEGYAIRLKAGKTIVFQSHYVNYEDKDAVVADVARLTFSPTDDVTEVGYLIANHNTISVPPGQSEQIVDCNVPESVGLMLLMGHMHEQGKSIHIDLTRGDQLESLYEVDAWTTHFRDKPPINKYDIANPLMIEAGDRLTVHCNYDNPTGDTLNFPKEMCTAVAYYFPAIPGNELVLCD